MSSRWRRYLARGAAVTLGVLLPLVAVELGYRAVVGRPPSRSLRPRDVACGDCPYVFELDRRLPDVSSQRLRDREFPLVPEEGTQRILVLGDSLPYGPHVGVEHTFPKVLERRLGGEAAHVEVMNSGVLAYSPFNEREYYASRLRAFHPSLVVISFCMNDVVDPTLHWAKAVGGRSPLDELPPDAIPNPAYHRDHALPLLQRHLDEQGSHLRDLLDQSAFYRVVVDPLLGPGIPDTSVTAGGKKYPAYLTGEDTLSIEVLMDWDSTEWVWLRKQYDEMIADIRSDGAEVVILVNPLRYQLEEGYPLFPQHLFARYCAQRKVACFDVGPALRKYGGASLFIGTAHGVLDIWHYNAKGHAVVGAALADFLLRRKLFVRPPSADADPPAETVPPDPPR
jgi:hypothetical protein